MLWRWGGLDSFFDVPVGFVAGKYKLELPPHPGCNRHHQDYEPFLVGNPYKPLFVTVTGRRVDRRYKTYHMEVLKKRAVNSVNKSKVRTIVGFPEHFPRKGSCIGKLNPKKRRVLWHVPIFFERLRNF